MNYFIFNIFINTINTTIIIIYYSMNVLYKVVENSSLNQRNVDYI